MVLWFNLNRKYGSALPLYYGIYYYCGSNYRICTTLCGSIVNRHFYYVLIFYLSFNILLDGICIKADTTPLLLSLKTHFVTVLLKCNLLFVYFRVKKCISVKIVNMDSYNFTFI